MKIFLKKSGENKNKLRTIYPKNHGNFRNSKPRVEFYWFLYKKECITDKLSVSDHFVGLALKG